VISEFPDFIFRHLLLVLLLFGENPHVEEGVDFLFQKLQVLILDHHILRPIVFVVEVVEVLKVEEPSESVQELLENKVSKNLPLNRTRQLRKNGTIVLSQQEICPVVRPFKS